MRGCLIKSKKAFISVALVLLISVASSSAFALRCSNHLVGIGDTRLRVQHFCGEPNDRVVYRDYAPVRHHYYYNRGFGGDNLIEEWFYNFGPTRFIYILTFRNGRLIEIDTGERGF